MVQTAAVSPPMALGAQLSKSAQLLKNAAQEMATTTVPTVLMMSLMTNACSQEFLAAITHSKLARMMESTSLARLNAATSQRNSAQHQTAASSHTLAALLTQPSTPARVNSTEKPLSALMLTTDKTTLKMPTPNAVTTKMVSLSARLLDNAPNKTSAATLNQRRNGVRKERLAFHLTQQLSVRNATMVSTA